MDFPKSMPDIGLVNGQFVDEDPATGQVGTYIPSSWGNAVTDEIINVIENAGLEPAEGQNDQLYTAISQLIASNLSGPATEQKSGISKIATQEEVNLGVSDEKIVTPQKLSRRPVAYPNGHLHGLRMSNNAASPQSQITIEAGSARDSTNTFNIDLGFAMSGVLQPSGSWSAGSGGNKLDTGSRAASTWYHVFVIYKVSNGGGDFLISLSPTMPAMPLGYSGFRRIGSIRTDSNSGITPFINVGRMFWWSAPIKDAAGSMAANAVSEVTLTLSVPTGVRVLSRIHAAFTGNANNLYFRSTDASTISTTWLKSNSLAFLVDWNGGLGMNTYEVDFGSWPFETLTNSAAAVVMQYQNATLAGFFSVVTLGWTEF